MKGVHRITRMTSIIVVVILMLGLLAGCQNGGTTNAGSTFRLARGWTRTGIINHYGGGTDVGALAWLSCEPLVQYVRTTDELFYLLAESIDHNSDGTSIIHVREGVKWHDGEPFTAADVVAFYNINFTTITNYWAAPPEAVDTYTVKVKWKHWMEPDDETKTLLFAMDKVGTIPYHVFHEYVDRAQEILAAQQICEDGYEGWAPFCRINDTESDTAYSENYKAFSNTNPEVFCATGPYKLAAIDQTQMILQKNEEYYFKDRIPYETVVCYNITDLSVVYSMLLNGELDYQDGFAPDTMIEQITQENEDMVHLKAYDPASVGILFNMEKEIWTDNVRLAFQYLFDREEVKNSANRYAITSYYPVCGMAMTEVEKYINEDLFAAIPQYSHDEAKANALLEAEGWKKVDGSWQFADGTPVKIVLGYDGSNAIMTGLAEGVQGALKAYGIDCRLKRAQDWSTWYALGSAEDSYYDFTINWTDVSASIGHPAGSYSYFFNGNNGPVIHIPTLTQEDLDQYGIPGYEIGNVNLVLNKQDGSGTFHVYEYLSNMYAMSGEELSEAVTDLVYGIGGQNYGVTFFQNVSGGFYNSKVIGNLPMEEIWGVGQRNVTVIPEMYSDDFYSLARISLEFSNEAALLFQYTDAALNKK